jgi:hypothetical protein
MLLVIDGGRCELLRASSEASPDRRSSGFVPAGRCAHRRQPSEPRDIDPLFQSVDTGCLFGHGENLGF